MPLRASEVAALPEAAPAMCAGGGGVLALGVGAPGQHRRGIARSPWQRGLEQAGHLRHGADGRAHTRRRSRARGWWANSVSAA